MIRFSSFDQSEFITSINSTSTTQLNSNENRNLSTSKTEKSISFNKIQHYTARVSNNNICQAVCLPTKDDFDDRIKIIHTVHLNHELMTNYDDTSCNEYKNDNSYNHQNMFNDFEDHKSTNNVDLGYGTPQEPMNLILNSETHQEKLLVDNAISLQYAEKEIKAIKNRIIICGLTLTIPLFLYLRFTIWNQ